jgi:hypothetical protein
MKSAAEAFRRSGRDVNVNVIDTHALVALQGLFLSYMSFFRMR